MLLSNQTFSISEKGDGSDHFQKQGQCKTGSFVCEVPVLGKNRDGLSLIAAILEEAARGTTKTRIMQNANLSFKLLEKYLHTTTRLGFIQKIESHYRLTVKGRQFLREYRKLNQEYMVAQDKLMELEHKRTLLEQQCQEDPQENTNRINIRQSEKLTNTLKANPQR